MAKLTLNQLKEMIREAVRDQIDEQLSGGINVGGNRRGYMGGTQHAGGGMKAPAADKGLDVSKFGLDELAAMMKDNPNLAPEAKEKIKAQMMKLLKAAGW